MNLTVIGDLAIDVSVRLSPPSSPVPLLNLRNGVRLIPVIFPPFAFGPMIACVWINLWLGRRWRPERSWVDRAGRVLGIFWMLWSLPHLWLLMVDM